MILLFVFSLVWQVNTSNVFSKNEYPFTYLNFFHSKTRPLFARRFILNDSTRDSLSIIETERRLRGLGVFRNVQARRTKDTVCLYLHDAFSMSLFIDYKFYNDERDITLGVEEDNFLGTLTKVNAYYFFHHDRHYYQGGLSIPGFPLRTVDLVAYFQRGENIKKNMLMLNPFITPLIKTYLNALYIRQVKSEYLYRAGEVFDTTQIDYALYSVKVGRAVRKRFTFVPYLASEYLRTKDTFFSRIGAGVYYVKLGSIKARYMRRSLYNDYLTKGIIARLELYPLFKGSERLSVFVDAKAGRPDIYLESSGIYSLSRSSGYARWKNKLYVRLPYRFTFFGYSDMGIIHDVTTALSYENILVFSLGADNGMYAYLPHYFNGREMALVYGEVRFFGPAIKKLAGFGGALFYGLGNAGEHISYLNRSFGVSLRVEAGILGPSAIYALNIGFKDFRNPPIFSFGTTLDFQ